MPPRTPPWQFPGSHSIDTAHYLADLRSNRPTRPGGSRPPPFKTTPLSSTQCQSRSESISDTNPQDGTRDEVEKFSDRRASIASFQSTSVVGRPLIPAPSKSAPSVRGRKVSPTASIQTAPQENGHYLDSGTRILERRESHFLREALERADRRDEEKKIHEDARDEAAELVWRHRNPEASAVENMMPYRNPDLWPSRKRISIISNGEASHNFGDGNLVHPKSAVGAQSTQRRRSSAKRDISNSSSKGIFRNPDDQIYEEPSGLPGEDVKSVTPRSPDTDNMAPLQVRSRNSLPRGSRCLLEKEQGAPVLGNQKLDQFEIHRNPPSQSRNAIYTVNPPTPPFQAREQPSRISGEGLEIRSEEIRAATSKSKNDRSAKLPTPSAVSDRPGRPIVSFDPAWAPSNQPAKADEPPLPFRPRASVPQFTVSAPEVPTLNTPNPPASDLPMIILQSETTKESTPKMSAPIPTIHFPDENDASPGNIVASTPSVTIGDNDTTRPSRPLPSHTQSCPTKPVSRLPWLNSGAPRSSLPTASCSNCSLPISGRILTASSGDSNETSRSMFHPECFTCHHCSTSLEHVSFYPEPPSHREERLASCTDPPELDQPRFFCHLDFHELFSPRCRSCHTPIEDGQVILACGHSYHVGHFYCAECGDPFAAETPFVEKDGYAYCVGCHTKRTSARCRGCKKLLTGQEWVEGLGAKWHEECFCCVECGGGFDRDDGKFFIRLVQGELTEKEKRKGICGKMEERAVCVACEGRRLKA